MAVNRGKNFEQRIREAFEKVDGVSIDRLHDQTTGFKGSTNICDFIVYKKPYEYYIECKSVHGATLSIHSNDPKRKYGVITNTQWEGMLEKSKIPGVFAGVICWYVDYDLTVFIPIQFLQKRKEFGWKSIHYGVVSDVEYESPPKHTVIKGKKKRVFFEYDMEEFFDEVQSN